MFNYAKQNAVSFIWGINARYRFFATNVRRKHAITFAAIVATAARRRRSFYIKQIIRYRFIIRSNARLTYRSSSNLYEQNTLGIVF